MKKLIFLLSILSFFIVSCSQQGSYHEVRWDEKGKDSVVYVQYQDENGNMNNFFMNYLLFRSLFSSGGYSSVNNYYTSHPSEFNNSLYRNYTSRSSSDVSSTSSSSTNRSYSSPSRSSSSSSSGFSSPSRSSSSSSSPSRSYSSPSRSYSSPSRSTSSPSRR